MHGTWKPSAAGSGSDDYDEQLRRLQADLRDSEIKRMELERKMLEYSKSDTCLTNMKHMRLKKYLKEICDRQKKSLLRNQDLLKEFDWFEAHIRKFASRSESLQKLKAEYEREMKSRRILERENILKHEETDDIKHQNMPEARQAGINNRTAMSRGLYHTATIFMGRQMSAVSSIDDFHVQQKSSELTKSFSISDPHTRRQPSRSSYMTDSCVVQTNSDLQCSNKSDKIDGKTYLLMGEEMPVTSSISHENERTHCLTAECDTSNCSGNFVEKNTSPECNSPLHERLSPENRTTDLKSDSSCKSLEETLTHRHFVNEQESKQPISLACRPEQLVSGNEHSREKFSAPGGCLQLDKNVQDESESRDESSDLSVSLSEDEEEIDLLKPHLSLQDVGCHMSVKPANTAYNEVHQHLQCHDTSSLASSSSHKTRECLSFEGFSHLLTFIEEMVVGSASDCPLFYQSKAVNAAELDTLISLCNESGSLKREDLEICEALVLHQLQRLLQSMENKCLLPDNAFNSKSETLDENQSRPELTSYFTRLCKHAWLLQKHNVSVEQEVKYLFDSLLILQRLEQSDQATSLLKESFPEAYESKSLAFSSKTSCNSQKNNSLKKQGLNIDDSGLKEQKSDRTSSEPSISSLERSSLSRGENQKKMPSTIKSKAFWGDSDDSNSDIEAALRPQVQSSHEEDFDDFYD
ncbi:centrosomal protein kizuna isoform X2 [Pogona vitticeps]